MTGAPLGAVVQRAGDDNKKKPEDKKPSTKRPFKDTRTGFTDAETGGRNKRRDLTVENRKRNRENRVEQRRQPRPRPPSPGSMSDDEQKGSRSLLDTNNNTSSTQLSPQSMFDIMASRQAATSRPAQPPVLNNNTGGGNTATAVTGQPPSVTSAPSTQMDGGGSLPSQPTRGTGGSTASSVPPPALSGALAGVSQPQTLPTRPSVTVSSHTVILPRGSTQSLYPLPSSTPASYPRPNAPSNSAPTTATTSRPTPPISQRDEKQREAKHTLANPDYVAYLQRSGQPLVEPAMQDGPSDADDDSDVAVSSSSSQALVTGPRRGRSAGPAPAIPVEPPKSSGGWMQRREDVILPPSHHAPGYVKDKIGPKLVNQIVNHRSDASSESYQDDRILRADLTLLPGEKDIKAARKRGFGKGRDQLDFSGNHILAESSVDAAMRLAHPVPPPSSTDPADEQKRTALTNFGTSLGDNGEMMQHLDAARERSEESRSPNDDLGKAKTAGAMRPRNIRTANASVNTTVLSAFDPPIENGRISQDAARIRDAVFELARAKILPVTTAMDMTSPAMHVTQQNGVRRAQYISSDPVRGHTFADITDPDALRPAPPRPQQQQRSNSVPTDLPSARVPFAPKPKPKPKPKAKAKSKRKK